MEIIQVIAWESCDSLQLKPCADYAQATAMRATCLQRHPNPANSADAETKETFKEVYKKD